MGYSSFLLNCSFIYIEGGIPYNSLNVVEKLLGSVNPVNMAISDMVCCFSDNKRAASFKRILQQQPLFPFGHGLSYTDFTYGEAKLSKNTIAKGENVVLTIPVSNVGQRDGEEVVQVYLRRPGDKEGPRYTLRAFKRVHIPAGKTESVAIPLTGENFEWFDVESNTMRPLEGTYELLYGGTSDRNKLKTIVMNVQ